eukprot:364641-Chlamydomonas_euryale.AAC.3
MRRPWGTPVPARPAIVPPPHAARPLSAVVVAGTRSAHAGPRVTGAWRENKHTLWPNAAAAATAEIFPRLLVSQRRSRCVCQWAPPCIGMAATVRRGARGCVGGGMSGCMDACMEGRMATPPGPAVAAPTTNPRPPPWRVPPPHWTRRWPPCRSDADAVPRDGIGRPKADASAAPPSATAPRQRRPRHPSPQPAAVAATDAADTAGCHTRFAARPPASRRRGEAAACAA